MQNIRVTTTHTIVAKQRCVTSWFLVNSLNEPISSCLIKASESKYSTTTALFFHPKIYKKEKFIIIAQTMIGALAARIGMDLRDFTKKRTKD